MPRRKSPIFRRKQGNMVFLRLLQNESDAISFVLQPRGPKWAARAGLAAPPFRRPFRAILHLFENASAKKRILGLADVSSLEKPGCVREAHGDRRQAAGVAYAHGI